MKTFKKLRFWLVWSLAAPLVVLYLAVAALFSGQWLLIGVKLSLIHTSLYQRFVEERHANLEAWLKKAEREAVK